MQDQKDDKDTNSRIEKLESRFEDLNQYLSKNGEIVIDLVMRVAALENLLKSKNLFDEKEISNEVQATYSILAQRAKENLADS